MEEIYESQELPELELMELMLDEIKNSDEQRYIRQLNKGS